MPDTGNVNDILSGLPPETRKRQYKGTQDVLDVAMEAQFHLDSDTAKNISQYIIFSGVNEQAFNQLATSNQELISKSVDSYNPTFQILLVKLTNNSLEKAYTGVTTAIMEKLSRMGNPALSLRAPGNDLIHTASRRKRADQEFQPQDLPEGRSDTWPSAVIEVGYTESKLKLQLDIQWWLEQSKGDAKLGLIILVSRQKREITIQKWELVDRQTRTEPERQVPVLKQQFVVSNEDGKLVTAGLTDAPLTISFEDLFLRRPQGPEGDVVLTEGDLNRIAELIWERQTF